ncbi:MAG: glycosyltransferase [Candidatus Goldbacteria bacterium]|nr:glycosyltransferase [Candidatus Goldiibacteriota bacterium]
MNILIINTLYKPFVAGGAEKICEQMAIGLKDKGYNVDILTTYDNKFSSVQIDYIDGLKVYRVPIKNIYWHYNKCSKPIYKRIFWHITDIYNILMIREIKKILDITNYDIAITHNIVGFSSSIWQVLRVYKIPIIHVLHDLYLVCPVSTMFKNEKNCEKRCFKCYVFRFFHPYFSNKVAAVVGVSKYVLDKNLQYKLFKKTKIKTFIHNVLKYDKLPEFVFLNDHNLFLGYIGSLTPSKGIEYLLDIMLSLTAFQVVLLVAGKGNLFYENYLKEKYKFKNIIFLGYQDPSNFFKKINCLVVPSLGNDTFPTVILESFVHGVPVIASKVGGIPEIVNDSNGFLFDPKNNQELRNIILSIIKNREIINSKIKYILDNRHKYINWKKWIEDYENIIFKVKNI